jgi:hypothetical protein
MDQPTKRGQTMNIQLIELTSDAVAPHYHRLQAAQNGAFCKSGPNKGYLKTKCPPMGTDAAILWQACAFVVNPYKVSIAQLIWLNDDQQAFFNLVQSLVTEMLKRKRKQVA